MKRILMAGLISLLFSSAALAATYSSTVLSNNPLGYYRMDETSGTTAVDSAGTAQNGVYRNGNTTAANPPTAGAPLLNQPGPTFPGFAGTNRSVSFDGLHSGGPFDAANTDNLHITSLSFSNNTTYTYEGWVFNTRPNNTQPITGYLGGRGTTGNFDAVGIMGTLGGFNPGRLFLFNDTDLLQGTTNITTNEWHHFAYTRSGTNVALYLDGALQGTSAIFANDLGVPPNNTITGAVRPDGFYPMQGRLDEVAVYDNAALSAAQINAHYNAAFSTGLYSINNANFDSQDVDSSTNLNQVGVGDGAYSLNVIQGWTPSTTAVSTFGVFDPTNSAYAGAAGDGSPTGAIGDQIGFINTSGVVTLSQTLPDPIQAGEYTFTLAIGDRLDTTSGGYLLELLAGNTVVDSDTGAVLPNGAFIDRMVSFDVPANSSFIGQLLTLRISNVTAGATDFDNARLTFIAAAAVPEPNSLSAMVCVGLIVLAIGAKFRAKQQS